ncbi:hypothetical protein [Flammeovirga aprica]|uniref:Uncharacterized protein n=1 Tax=Flammeovirga aprica JL-4 TaxID=694437 RepID=A0A7X9X9Y6_9BACT|nr:hypothetical protein [Flammeovirga aprica]NME69175.1 hypothetical protein [Flammeovirga aprica JL-4]
MASKTLHVSKKENSLVISYDWYEKSVFIIFGGVIAFSYFLYILHGVLIDLFNALSIFFLFVLFFYLAILAFILFMTYLSLCSLCNTTTIKIENEELTIENSPFPIPWKSNVKLDVNDIEQLYVEKNKMYISDGEGNLMLNPQTEGEFPDTISRIKQGLKGEMSLYLRTTTGKSVEVLSMAQLGSHERAINIERTIEDYLNIQDYAVEGEHEGEKKFTKEELRRNLDKKKINPTAIAISDLKEGFVFDYDLYSWMITFMIQYDWLSGSTDRLLQMVSDSGDNKLLYLQEQFSGIIPWMETKSENFKFPSFDKSAGSNIPYSLDHNGENYSLSQTNDGKLFHKKQILGSEVSQYFFLNSDDTKSIRIIWLSDSNYSIYLGEKKEERHFDNILHSS